MSKKVAVLVEQQFHDTELWISYYRILEAGFEVTLEDAAKFEMSASEAKELKWDAIIAPGG